LAPLWRRLQAQAGLPQLRLQALAGCFAALGPEAVERFLRAAPLPKLLAAEAAGTSRASAPVPAAPRVPLVGVPRAVPAPALRPASPAGPVVTLGPEAVRPSAALLAWRAKAEAAGDASPGEIDASD
ncbi:MAG: hypothetical protein ACFCUQ_21870, partial [Kiloniellales bacterium]